MVAVRFEEEAVGSDLQLHAYDLHVAESRPRILDDDLYIVVMFEDFFSWDVGNEFFGDVVG